MFGFPVYNRPTNCHFNKNFLRSVIIQVKHPKNSNIVAKKKELASLLTEHFPNNKDLISSTIEIKAEENKTKFLPTGSGVSGILFETKDKSKSINISEDSIVINYSGLVYKNFESLMVEVENLIMKIFEICEIKSLSWISMRKINLIQFESNDQIKPFLGMASVFNNGLISSFASIPGNEFLNSGISNISLTEGKHTLNLTSGLVPSPDKIRNLILDIDLYFQDSNISKDILKSKLSEINTEIFNVFNWSLLDQAIKQLNE